MQRAPVALDIDGHKVHTGATVQVKWLGVWYEGTVIKIGPKKHLCKVRDYGSGETVLLEPKHLQFRETHLINKEITSGANVVFNDEEVWREGVVETRSAIGIVQVSWRKSGLSEENLTWFEQSHIAPVIHNDLYKEHNRDMLEAGKSGLLHNDAIEPRPRTMDNLLYESGSDNEADILAELASSQKQLHNHSPEQTTVDDKKYDHTKSKENKKSKVDNEWRVGTLPQDGTFPPLSAPVFMALPPMMNHPYGNMFLPLDQNQYMKLSSSFKSAPSSQQKPVFIPHPRLVKRPGLAQTSSPCVMSYTGSSNGIPPHSCSRFFQSIRDEKLGKRKLGHRKKQKMKKSPTVQSRANSEPTEYARVDDLDDNKEPLSLEKSNAAKKERVLDWKMLQTNEQRHTQSLPKPTQKKQMKSQVVKANLPTKHGQRMQTVHKDPVPPPLPPRPSPHSQPTIERAAPTLHSSTDSGMEGREREIAQSSRERLRLDSHSRKTTSATGLAQQHANHMDNTQLSDREDCTVGLAVISASPAYVTVPHGGSTLLSCVARSSRSIHYHWFRDDTPISDQDPFFTKPAPGMLQIEMAALQLMGEYKCVVSDGQDSLEKVFHLEVTSDGVAQSGSGGSNKGAQVPPEYAAAIDNDQKQSSQQLKPSRPQPPIIVVNGTETDSSPPQPFTYNDVQVTNSPPTPLPSCRDTPDDQGRAIEADGVREKEKEKVEESRKRMKRDRRRASTTLKNDMEQYLGGYGENYGALSSNSLELWQQGLSEDETKQNRGKKKRKEKKKKGASKSSSQGSSSPNKSTTSIKHGESPKKNVSFGTLPPGDDYSETNMVTKETDKIPIKVARTKDSRDHPTRPEPQHKPPARNLSKVVVNDQEEEETNSVEVNTSVGASSAESDLEGHRGEKLQLPQESLSDSVRRLQLSVQEHCPEQLQLAEKEKKKGFLSNIFTRNTSS